VRAVLDTNVLVAALRSQRGASFQLLQLVRAGKLTPVVSVPLLFEYEDVLCRPGMLPTVPASAIAPFLDAFLRWADLRNVYFLWRPMLTDPKDEMLVELAFAAGDVPIVTLNTRDLTPAVQRLGLRVLTPAQMLAILNGASPQTP
jgi:putative PIN family toxin of toxin-antitoxin system